MRSIAQALIGVTLIASASTSIAAQGSNKDAESGNRDALRALASLQVVHSASLGGRDSPAFAGWLCTVHQLNPNKSDNSQDWKVSYLTNCSGAAAAFAAPRNARSDDWVLKFLGASGTGAVGRRGQNDQGEDEEGESSEVISVPDGSGLPVSAGGIGGSSIGGSSTGSSSTGNSSGGLSSASAGGNTLAVTETITNPEPSTILLVSSGLAMLGASTFRRRRS